MSDKLYKCFGLFWQIDTDYDPVEPKHVFGPLCPTCYSDLDLPDDAFDGFDDNMDVVYRYDWSGEADCVVCDKKVKISKGVGRMRHVVSQSYTSKRRELYDKHALDEPPTQVKAKDEDDNYFISAKIGYKDGKKVGVVYFGEKKKDQSKKDYAQIFVDLDDEQVRFDKANKHPKELVASMIVTFPDTKITADFKKKT